MLNLCDPGDGESSLFRFITKDDNWNIVAASIRDKILFLLLSNNSVPIMLNTLVELLLMPKWFSLVGTRDP